MVLVLAWLALSVIVTLAYVFGASVGYRRGLADAGTKSMRRQSSVRVVASPDMAVEVQFPEDAQRAT